MFQGDTFYDNSLELRCYGYYWFTTAYADKGFPQFDYLNRSMEQQKYQSRLKKYNVEHDIWIMPIVKNIEHFQYWVSAYPFYRNIHKEGVTLYETA